jgi:hypothetical protein
MSAVKVTTDLAFKPRLLAKFSHCISEVSETTDAHLTVFREKVDLALRLSKRIVIHDQVQITQRIRKETSISGLNVQVN